MATNQNHSEGKIPVWMIVVGFCFSFWPGAILLGIRLWQDYSQRTNGATRRSDSEWAKNAQNVTWRDVNGQRTYQPPRQQSKSGSWNADGTYHYSYRAGNQQQAQQSQAQTQQTQQTQQTRQQTQMPPRQTQQPRRSLLDHYKLSPKAGKALRLAGNIALGAGALVSAIVMLALLDATFRDLVIVSSITALITCTPGAVMSIIGSRKHDRVMRCRTYAAMLGEQKCIRIDDLASAIPTSYKRCCDDLNWMLSEGMLKGMYIDGANHVLTYPGAFQRKTEPASAPAPAPAPVATDANGRRIYPEEQRIHDLNVEIQDEYVSQRMDRLEYLTHQILAYAEEHPDKESQLRQFRGHYLPKTFSILESYARMERSGIEGGNIAAAMKDVEAIMDKLVLGFEKQLDALFDSEAMDVTSDITVLENMMSMEGLSDLDPFGSLRQDDQLLRR